ncbi:unnamed protein product [Cunninghamella blakesleeana]
MDEKGIKGQKNSASKYDFVKVRVHLSDQHYYVLSRFILCRMLTAAQIQYSHALRIALDLKKRLVDKGQLDISQQDLQNELFQLFIDHGYGVIHIERYKTVSSFHHQRIPLVILIAGTGLTGKSTMATRLSERLNLSSVLKTDVIYDLMHTILDGKMPQKIWNIDGTLEQFQQKMIDECKLVYKGLDTDVCKSIGDGKSVIIEGDLIDHHLLDCLLKYLDKIFQQHQHKPIIVPLLLIIPEESTHLQLIQECPNINNNNNNNNNEQQQQQKDHILLERIRSWQQHLLNINLKRGNLHQSTYQVIQMDMDHFPTLVDHIQAIVLEKIAFEMSQIKSF